jgi:oxalate decarboxylase/phosphoglucose isomerase-like protein (cupin superfamily)
MHLVLRACTDGGVVPTSDRRPAGPYTSFYCPPSVLHGIRNTGDKELKYLVIKKYETK